MNTINFENKKAGLLKIRNIIGNAPKIVMMATRLDKVPFSVCPMTIQQMDNQGDLWFFTSKESDLFEDISYENSVQFLFSDNAKHDYLSVYGHATQIVDEQ